MKQRPKQHRLKTFDSKKGHFKRVPTARGKSLTKYKNHLWITSKTIPDRKRDDTSPWPSLFIDVWKHIPDDSGGEYFWHVEYVFYRRKIAPKKYKVQVKMRVTRGLTTSTTIVTSTHRTSAAIDKRISRLERSLYSWLKTHDYAKTWKPPKR